MIFRPAIRSRKAVTGAALGAALLAVWASPVVTARAASHGTAAARSCSAGYVALTFDDGPQAGSTPALLTALGSVGVRATLFNIGQNVAANPGLVATEQSAGMWIGNHSYTHPHLTTLGTAAMTQELSRTQQAITAAGGARPTIFRPPYGDANATLQAVAAGLGLATVTWTVDSRDWAGASTDQIVAAARSLQPGGVILMHDGYATARAAIPRVVADLTARGLCDGRISPSTGRAVAP